MEIGCEELPADYLPGALDWEEGSQGLVRSATAVLEKKGVRCKGFQSFGTPRRLVLLAQGVAPVVKKQEKGPPAQVAFDAQGKPTRAAEAFAQKHGLKVAQLVRRDSPKGPLVFAEYDLPVTQILSAAVPEIIQGIRFPKTMRWDESGVRFARPIRRLLTLYGSSPVSCSFGSLKSSAPVKSAAAYFLGLKRLKIRLEDSRMSKRKALLGQLETEAKKLGGRLPDQTTEEFERLINTVTFLAESPFVAAGSFRPEYLELPPEVLQTSMAKHLKLFGIREKAGEKLLPRFLAVLEGKPLRPEAVMANVDRIIEARFTDARFFYKEDTKTPLEAKVPELAKISFHEKLGAVADRIPRLRQVINGIMDLSAARQRPDWQKILQESKEAGGLCKADLVTQMVREFPTLQGTIGGYYARVDGRPGNVAEAIAEHYKPRAAKDPVPSTPAGAILSLADRVDTLTGYFGVGLKPTGSADPYGLRRQALGLVRILIEPPEGISFIGLSFDRLFDESIQSWGAKLTLDPKTLKEELRAFLRERFEWLALREASADDRGGTVPAAEEVPQRGCAAARELTAAVLAAGDDDLAGAWERLQVLRSFWSSRDGKRIVLERAAKVAERTGRIVQSVKGMDLPAAVDAAALKDPLERELWNSWSRLAPQLKEQLARRAYEEATRSYSTLYPAVRAFFEKVFVMDENLNLRRNRLALMKEIYQSLSRSFADLSKLPLAGVEPPDA